MTTPVALSSARRGGVTVRELTDNPLGVFLRSRRERLDPVVLGMDDARARRTPGLRRTEVASRAQISVEWYTRLEQGRGGDPSPQVLDAVASALCLDDAEREHVFLLARGPDPKSGSRSGPALRAEDRDALQRVVDGFPCHPAFIKTAAWDVVVWNRAAAAVLTDYVSLPAHERNVLRILFLYPAARKLLENWEHEAKLAVATFRLELARAGGDAGTAALIAELQRTSPDFAAFWRRHDVGTLGEGTKYVAHPRAGRLAMRYSSYSVDALPGLGLVVYTPATDSDTRRIRDLLGDGDVT